ncbi:MAG: acetyl/propionyl/methylcrotonyl-CoA carboxylase subunit alpha [Rhodospirillaceae bacterium]
MFNTILIANRGEIACRIIRSARAMGIKTIAVYSEADHNALHVDMASEAVLIGPPPATESYLNMDVILEVCKDYGVDAVHPGYGFLSEKAEFAERLAEAGVTFIGPGTGAIQKMGDKIESKKLAQEAGVPTVPGYADPLESATEAAKLAKEIGFPVMLKASAGGGGKGMRLVDDPADLEDALRACIAEAESSFGDGRVFIEKFVTTPRHIEIQVLADSHGNTIHLGERECSIQRRHQKVIEEAPSPFVDSEMRNAMGQQGIALAKAVDYVSAGTIEFIVDADKNFYFLEMNTRLQVEHPVTELVTGIDLVEQMIRIADGEKLQFTQDDITFTGWAMESRIYAEDPVRGFLPSIGRLVRYREPVTGAFGTSKNVRVDGGINEGDEINRFYDPMIAKLVTNGETRVEAIRHMRWALDEYYIRGVANNLGFLAAVMMNERFVAGNLSTNFIAEEFGDRFIADQTEHKDIHLLAAVAAAVHRIIELRKNGLQSRLIDGTLAPREVIIEENQWVVVLNDQPFPAITNSPNGSLEVRVGERNFVFETSWAPGQPLFTALVNGDEVCVQVERDGPIYKLQHMGLTAEARVLSPLAAEMLARMPEKEKPDTSKQVISPMPGLLVSLSVAEGDVVKQGEPVAVIEAMKMENQLFAESDGTVAKIHFEPGNSLAVGALIIELE